MNFNTESRGETWGLDAVEEFDANLSRFYSIWQAISDFGNPNGCLLAGSGKSIPGMTYSWKRPRLCENSIFIFSYLIRLHQLPYNWISLGFVSVRVTWSEDNFGA